MNYWNLLAATGFGIACALRVSAGVLYVNVNSASPAPPYHSWTNAARVIQQAVDAAGPGDQVLVTNGVYQTGGRAVYGAETNAVVLTNGVTVLSVNGAQATALAGGIQTRCVYVGSNSVISGFTLSGGQAGTGGDTVKELSGAGAWCETGGLVTNCVVTGNRTLSAGGLGGGVYGGTICNCTLSNNNAGLGGAAAAAVLQNCLLVSNSAPYSLPFGLGGALYKAAATNCTLAGNGWGYGCSGGGAYLSTLANCLLVTNLSTYGAGGAQQSLLDNCTLSQNRGAVGGAYQCTNYNCVFTNNSGGMGGAISGGLCYNCLVVSNNASYSGAGAYQSTLYNCTVVGNVSTNGYGGGVYNGGAANSIIYYNTALSSANWSSAALSSCLTLPSIPGFTGEPSFVDLPHGNLRLQTNSLCINSGNNDFLTGSTDLDGNPRLAAGLVDLGAYEFQNPVSVLPYAWLLKYGVPINAGTDTADNDGDGLNNWQEWRAGTAPNDPSSALRLLAPGSDASGVTLSWRGTGGKFYYLQRGTNLAAAPAFYPLVSNLPSQVNITTYKDASATNTGPYFYRLGLQ